MPIFNVLIEGTIVMVAETAEEARNKARDLLISGKSLGDDLTAIVATEIRSEEDLIDQWELDWMPYGEHPEKARPIKWHLEQKKK
jgi:hypothetical protein